MIKNWVKIILVLIIFLGFILRVYKLTSVPPSLNWDEVAAAYNAFTIKNWGMDEWGNKFPLVFTSFRDDKHPIHIYATALTYLILGVSDFTTRFPSAIVGTLAILFIFILVKFISQNSIAGLFSALFLAISPYAVHYSRGLWEANFAASLFIMGFGSFFYGLKKKKYFIIFSYLFFGLSLLSYHASKVVVPPVVFLLTLLNIKGLLVIKREFIAGFAIFAMFVGLLFVQPRLLGLARVAQTKLDPELVRNTFFYKKFDNELLGRMEVSLTNYQKYFSYNYLFKIGDQEPRGSFKNVGEFYKFNIILAPLGILFLIFKKKWKFLLVFLSWLLLSPVAGALSGSNPNSTRSIFMLGTLETASGIGTASIYMFVKNKRIKIIFLSLLLLIVGYETYSCIDCYFSKYSKNEAIQWQYGMKQAAMFVKNNLEYDRIYVTKIRNQPYIFFLYYLRYPLPKLLNSVKYDETGSKSYNTIESFGKYNFGNWDYIESKPEVDVLFIVTKSEFTGFRYGNSFNIKEIIKFPGGDEAFYIVSAF